MRLQYPRLCLDLRDDRDPPLLRRSFNLNEVKGVDLVMSYWAGDEIAHVFVSLTFDDGCHLAVSVRHSALLDRNSSTLGGFFRNYELIYVIANERDLIGVRTDMRWERVYIYPLQTAPGTPRCGNGAAQRTG